MAVVLQQTEEMMVLQNHQVQELLMVVMVYQVQSLDLQSQEVVAVEAEVMRHIQTMVGAEEQVVVEEVLDLVYQLQLHLQ